MKIISSLFRFNQPDTAAAADRAVKAPAHQSPDKMLKTLAEAERLGLRTRLDADNNLRLGDSSRSVWGRIRLLFERKPVGIENRDAIVGAVIGRMKEQIGQTTRHVDSVITRHLPDLGRFAQTGEVGKLRDQWSSLQNILQRGVDVHEQVQAARKDLAAPPPSAKPLAAAAPAPASAGGSISGPVMPAPVSVSLPLASFAYDDARERIDEANRSLPHAMPKFTATGQTLRCTLSVPADVQLNMFDDWRQWRVHEKDLHHQGPDPFVGLSEAFSKDANRATYVFEKDGFAVECERDSEAVAIGFKDIVGKNPTHQLILSHLLGQEALKRMLEKVQKAHPRPDGLPFFLGGASVPEFTRHRLYLSVQDNGDIDIDYLSLMKSTHLVGDPSLIEINRSKRFEGLPSRDNAGLCLSMKIRISKAELDRGQLRFDTIDPLKVTLQAELPDLVSEA